MQHGEATARRRARQRDSLQVQEGREERKRDKEEKLQTQTTVVIRKNCSNMSCGV